MKSEILEYFSESISTKKRIVTDDRIVNNIQKACEIIVKCYNHKGKVLLCGNGGSAGDAQHIAGELVGRFLKERKALSAISLSTDPSVVTCIANDYGYNHVFERQVEAHGRIGDVLVGISTSGNSENVNLALKKAKAIGMYTIGLLGNDGGKAAGICDIPITVPSNVTSHIQECHITIGHIMCKIIEEETI